MGARNKYLTINPSTQVDDNGNAYPDLMTFPIKKFRYSVTPFNHYLNQGEIDRFDLLIHYYYGTSDYTDIILWLNSKKTVHDLVVGEQILIPDITDLETFYTSFITEV